MGCAGDWQHAEDLVQKVLVIVAARWSRITSDPLAYAYRCLVRANIDRWRLLHRRPEIMADPAALAALHSADDRPSTAVVEDRLGMLEALRALPSRQRAILVLRYLQTSPNLKPPRLSASASVPSRAARRAGWPGCASSWATRPRRSTGDRPRRANDPGVACRDGHRHTRPRA